MMLGRGWIRQPAFFQTGLVTTGLEEIQEHLLERCDYLSTDVQYHYLYTALTKAPMSIYHCLGSIAQLRKFLY